MDFHDFECQCSIHSSTIYSSYDSWNGLTDIIVFIVVFDHKIREADISKLFAATHQ